MTVWINNEALVGLADIGGLLDLYLFRRLPLPYEDEAPLPYRTLEELLAAGEAVPPIHFIAAVTVENEWTYLDLPDFDPVARLNDPDESIPMDLNTETVDPVAAAVVAPNNEDVVLYLTDNVGARINADAMVYPAKDEDGRRWLLKWATPARQRGGEPQPLGAVIAPRLGMADAVPPPYEAAHVQNVWVYPRRINMVANPRVQMDDDVYPYWRSSDLSDRIIWETNEMEGRTGLWTIQLQAKGNGYLKVGLVFWNPDDLTEVDTDWGNQTWRVFPDGWTHVNCLRNAVDKSTVQLRLEVMGDDFEFDYVVCEPGALLGWEYFDGDTVYGATDDHNWWGPRGLAYSGWYDNKRHVRGVVFDSTFIREITDPPPAYPIGGVDGRWGHAATQYSYWQAPNSGVLNPLWGPDSDPQALTFEEQAVIDLQTIDSSISEWRSGTVYRWLPAGQKIQTHWDVMKPYDLQLPPTDVSGTPPRDYNLVVFPAQYLVPTVGTATTTHGLGPLPDQVVFVCHLRGPTGATGTIAARYEADPDRSWLLRRATNGDLTFNISGDGTAATATIYSCPGPVPTGADEWIAVSRDNDGVNFVMVSHTSPDGVTWTQFNTSTTPSGAMALESASLTRVGAYGTTPTEVFNGRIYSVKLLTGVDPLSGGEVWTFNADEYPGTVLSYTDPRARTWVLTSATAIQPSRPAPGVDDPWSDWTETWGTAGATTTLGIAGISGVWTWVSESQAMLGFGGESGSFTES